MSLFKKVYLTTNAVTVLRDIALVLPEIEKNFNIQKVLYVNPRFKACNQNNKIKQKLTINSKADSSSNSTVRKHSTNLPDDCQTPLHAVIVNCMDQSYCYVTATLNKHHWIKLQHV